MDFGKIISRAWDIVKSRRYLWYLGLLAVGAEGAGGGGGNGSLSSGDFDEIFNDTDTNVPQKTSQVLKGVPKVLGDSTRADFGDFIANNWPAIVIVIGLLLLITLLIIWLGYVTKAGLILSVNNLETHKPDETFGSAFHKGRQFAWRLLGVDVVVGLFILLLLLVSLIPLIVALALEAGTAAYVITGIFLFIGIMALIAVSIYLGIAAKFGSRAIVIENIGALEALKKGRQLVKKQLKNSIFTWLINLGITMAYSLAVFFALMLVVLVLGAIGLGIYYASMTVLIVYIIIFGLLLVAALAILSGAFTAFFSSYWTMSYRAIDYLSKK